MKNKHIVIIIDSLGIGGAEKSVLEQIKQFHNNGYKISLITIYNKIQLDVPNFVNLKCLNWTDYKFFKYLKNSKNLFKIVNELKPFSLILVHLDKAIKLMKPYSQLFDSKIYYILHNNISMQDLKDLKNIKLIKKLYKTRKLYNNLNLITVSDGIKEDIINNIKIKPKSIQTIYNPINKIEIENLAQKEITLKDNYIIQVARLVPQKRHDIALKAFANSNLNTKLLLLGDGPEKENIIQLIKELSLEDKVILLGFQSNPYPYIKNAKLLLLSSEYEGFGMVILESLYLNTPVISTNCNFGPSEIFPSHHHRYLAKINDIDDLSQKLINVYNSPYNIKIKDYIKFNQETITKKFLDLITC